MLTLAKVWLWTEISQLILEPGVVENILPRCLAAFFHLCDINFHSHLAKWNCEHIFSIFPQPNGNHQKDVDMTNVSETEQKTFHVSVSVCLLITMNVEFLYQFCANSYWLTVT